MTREEMKERAEKIADLVDDLSANDAMDVHRAACEPIVNRRFRVAAQESVPAGVPQTPSE